MRNILITSALPYTNGDLHLGHMLEFIQVDIWIRYHRQYGNKCIYVSGSDTHGTPIMLKSLSENTCAEFLINKYELKHRYILDKFKILCNNFYTTHSYENENLSRRLFYRLSEHNFISVRYIDQLYDFKKEMFLPDRYVMGTCPRCFLKNQYGDVCEDCNYRYNAVDLINPISVISGVKPIKKRTKHYFLNLHKFKFFLIEWCKKTLSQKQIINKLFEWLGSDLRDWDICRDTPYFGFKIPGNHRKFFYVWMDAPIGYIASFYNYFAKFGKNFLNYALMDKSIELYHFIGKDILYFHTLFWPAVLKGVNFILPTDIFVHGFLTINDKKMSKSIGKIIASEQFLSNFDAECLRYYFASKTTPDIIDINFNFLDFKNKINSDLIGNFVNIFNRCSRILIDNYNCMLSDSILNYSLFDEFLKLKKFFISLYEKRKYSKIISYILQYADKINVYINIEKPWFLLRDEKTFIRAQIVCTTAINLFIILLINMKPIIPKIVSRIEYILNVTSLTWSNFEKPLVNQKINNYTYIISRIIVKEKL